MEPLPPKTEIIRQLLELMLAGLSYQQAVAQLSVPVPIKQSRAYQLLQQARATGQTVWPDQRHGHPAKFRAEVTDWLKQRCSHSPQLTSLQLQLELHHQFKLKFSTSQINRLRVKLGVANSQASRKLQGLNKKKAT